MTPSKEADSRLAAPVTHAAMLVIAVPIIFSNLTTPLIGVVNTAVLGRLGEPHLIGAVALGGTIFNFLYWAFAFLRMGTTGLTAQSFGAGDAREVKAVLARSLIIALAAGFLIIALQRPIGRLALHLLGGSEAVHAGTWAYFGMRVWGAPAALANFALFGWFVGLGKARTAFVLQLLLNGLNIALAVLLGLFAGLAVQGVGLAAFLADTVAAVVGLVLAWKEVTRRGGHIPFAAILDRGRLARTLAVNRDIMIRTLCVVIGFSYFTAQLARGGDVTLAANAILLQFVTVSAYLLDGFAYAAEALVGQAIGARIRARFSEAVRISSLWAVAVGGVASLTLWLAGDALVAAMTTSTVVRAEAQRYLAFAAVGPVLGAACYQLDGIFIGATRTADMRNMMLLSLALYLVCVWTLRPWLGVTGLWISINVFYVVRALTLLARLGALEREAFGASSMH
jgi:MATE family multidrug resistance protein